MVVLPVRIPFHWLTGVLAFVLVSFMVGCSQSPSQADLSVTPTDLMEVVSPDAQISLTPTLAAADETTSNSNVITPEPIPVGTLVETSTSVDNPDSSVNSTSAEDPNLALDSATGGTATRMPNPTRTPYRWRTSTQTPTSTPPLAWMRIQKPGPYSQVTSPIKLESLIMPGDDDNVYVDLIGEDGRMITQQTLDFSDYSGRHFYISPEIPFSIKSAGETARVVVRVVDAFNRPISICSVDVVLLQVGRTEIYANPIVEEPYIVRSPGEGDSVSGGVLVVSGLARAVNLQPLIFELIDENGAVRGSAVQEVSQPYGDFSHVPFEVYVPYTVTEQTNVRMTIRQESDTRIPGTVWLDSWLLTLNP